MIVAMKKLSLLCRAADRDPVLLGLRDLGLVHVQAPAMATGEALDQARQRLTFLRSALEALPEHRPGATPRPVTNDPVDAVITRVWELVHEREELDAELAGLLQEERRIAPLGDFDPAEARALEERGVFVRLFRAPQKTGMPRPQDHPDAVLRELSRDENVVHFAAVTLAAPLQAMGEATPVALPRIPLEELRRRIAWVRRALTANAAALSVHSGDRPRIAALEFEAAERVRFLEIRQGMDLLAVDRTTEPVAEARAGEQLALLQGWFPARNEEAIRAAAASFAFGFMVAEPAPDENPPTLIENPRWVRPIQAVMDMIGVVPGYDEVDFSPLFLLFLSLFFAMLVGDAGYGLVFLALTAVLRLRNTVSSQITSLLGVMSVCTVVWGGLTGVWFGIERLPPLLHGLRIAWLTGPDAAHNTMLLCFFIGAVHLTLAHLWNVARLFPSPQFLAQAGWIATTWAMFFTARSMVLLDPFPQIMLWVLAGGAVLIVLFMTPPARLKTEWFNHVMFPLTLIGNFVDVVSYVRLFAVGAASLAVASSFNAMALELGASGPLAGLGAALILFFGHALNLLLAMMGVLVHGVRLNTLEFAGHLGLQWKGRKYDPFRTREAK